MTFRQAPAQGGTTAVVWLHGIGERGDHLPLVAQYGLPAALIEGRVAVNADVFCPQLEADQEWAPHRTQALIAALRPDYQHIALIGFSLGGLGVCELLSQLGPQADVHIAIAPKVRGPVVAPQVGTHFLLLAGEHDQWDTTPPFLQALAAHGATVDHAILPNEGHFISETALRHPAFVSAMAAVSVEFRWPQSDAQQVTCNV